MFSHVLHCLELHCVMLLSYFLIPFLSLTHCTFLFYSVKLSYMQTIIWIISTFHYFSAHPTVPSTSEANLPLTLFPLFLSSYMPGNLTGSCVHVCVVTHWGVGGWPLVTLQRKMTLSPSTIKHKISPAIYVDSRAPLNHMIDFLTNLVLLKFKQMLLVHNNIDI